MSTFEAGYALGMYIFQLGQLVSFLIIEPKAKLNLFVFAHPSPPKVRVISPAEHTPPALDPNRSISSNQPQ
jgi:hypothetical protein